MMTRWAVSAFGWQRRRKSDDESLGLLGKILNPLSRYVYFWIDGIHVQTGCRRRSLSAANDLALRPVLWRKRHKPFSDACLAIHQNQNGPGRDRKTGAIPIRPRFFGN
jgi:hypothetical protein